MMPVVAAAPAFLPALNALPTAAAVAALCVAVVVEIVLVPAVLLPGGTMTLLAGALIGAGRPAVAVAVPVVVAVVAGDQLAFFSGAAVTGWWRRRRPGRAEQESGALGAPGVPGVQPARRGRTAAWFTASMPSVAGGARMPYQSFAARILVMRVPWLAAALSAGTLAAHSLARIGHVAGIAGLVASGVVPTTLLVVHRRPGAVRAVARRTATLMRRLSTTIM
jgi:membrane protein DedA with SNARE-associated domain